MLSTIFTDLLSGLPQFTTLTDLQDVVLGLPQYANEPPKWYIDRKVYVMMLHSQYKYDKSIRKAKARKKRVNARCGRRS